MKGPLCRLTILLHRYTDRHCRATFPPWTWMKGPVVMFREESSLNGGGGGHGDDFDDDADFDGGYVMQMPSSAQAPSKLPAARAGLTMR